MSLSISECLAQSAMLTDSDTARLDSELLLAHVIKKSRSYLFTWPEKTLSVEQHDAFLDLLQRRKAGEPVAYLIGLQGFWNVDLKVNPHTLIPRPETELLVELALNYAGSDSKILDLGTGTGAIALALASELKDALITGVDRVKEAVELAEDNKILNRISNAQFFQSNWFSEIQSCFDVIVSNPPYIEKSDPHLASGDLRYEPHSALVSGADGLDDIRIIIGESSRYLFENGWLMIEHGYNQAERVQLLFAQAGFQDINTVKDVSHHDRITLGRYLA